MVFFYRRFLPLDVCIYAFGAENVASSSNLTIPFIKQRDAVSNLAFETASFLCEKLLKKRLICAIIIRQKNKRVASGYLFGIRCRAHLFALGDKEIAVKIRGNSHYRNSV